MIRALIREHGWPTVLRGGFAYAVLILLTVFGFSVLGGTR